MRGELTSLAGAEVTTLNELVAIIAEVAGVKPPSLHLPVWPVWTAGAVCEALCAPFGIEPAALPAPRRLLHQEPRLRYPAALCSLGFTTRRLDFARAFAAHSTGALAGMALTPT